MWPVQRSPAVRRIEQICEQTVGVVKLFGYAPKSN
jgi:hypothetical protein